MPKISVIISSYNHALYIGQAMQSVLDQTEQDFEILIGDDASTDNTLEVLNQFNDPRIHVYSFKENRKEYMKNYCLSQASGEYIAILNSDDYMHPERLALQVAFLEKNPKHLAVFSPYQEVDNNGIFLNTPQVVNQSRHEWLRYFLDKGNGLGHSCALIRKSFFDKHGLYNRWLLFVADLDLWIRICLEGEIQVLNQTLTFLRILPNMGNLGGKTLTVNNRKNFEWPIIFEHFYSKKGLSQLHEIFPDKPLPGNDKDRTIFLARHLTKHKIASVRLFANRKLYDLIPQSANGELEVDGESFYHLYYRSIGQTSYDSKTPAVGRFIAKNMSTKEILYELSFITRFGEDVLFSFEVDTSEKTALIFIPSNEPCIFSIIELSMQTETKTIDLKKKCKVAGTVILVGQEKFMNLGKRPTIRIPWKNLPKGKMQLNIRLNLSKNLSPFLTNLASK